mgnify:CR=1 FL=1
MDLKNTQTAQNLKAAFTEECKVYMRYRFYAAKARREGYEQIADLIEETAKNEKEHAEVFFRRLYGDPATSDDLQQAASGENNEWTKMYADFAAVAEQEGLSEISALFYNVGKIEKMHEQRFKTLLENVNTKQVFERPESQVWICQSCGHIHEGTAAPQQCPVCEKPQSFFEIKANNF